jgi:leader peptidase (prepilin peptidase)/N-methyltransferase
MNVWDELAPVLAAPFVGSFLGVLIRRLPAGRGIAWSRSACESCQHALGPADLVPIASFIALHGRCRHCAAPIARMHLAIELAALLVPLCALSAGLRAPDVLWLGCGLGWTLLALGWIDALWLRLPDSLTLPLLLAGLAQCWVLTPARLADHALAAIAAWAGLRGVALVYRRLRHRDGLGAGDAKLYAAAGAWIGLAGLPYVLLIAALLGLAAAGAGRLAGQRLTLASRIPFGPPLAAAIFMVWLAGVT